MKGDVLNGSRALSLRLSIVFAITTLVALFIFLTGNLGELSDEALLVSVRALGGAGVITIMFGVACIALSLLAKRGGARLPTLSIVLGLLMSGIGMAGASISALLQALVGGMSL
jgi:hypothetical protein